MMLMPGVGGWLMTMMSGSAAVFTFISLFLPIFGE